MNATTITPALAADMTAAVARALAEDVGSGDRTAALVPAGQQATATITVREAAVLCGQPWVDEVFRQLDPAVVIRWTVAEGAGVTAGTVACELSGPARPLLTGERTALNFLQTLSGTATAVRPYVEALAGTHTRVLDTRKTVPGLRLAQKYAVRIAGGTNHRLGLYDGILIKENHIIAAGGITAAVTAARQAAGGVLIQVEVENLAEAEEALRAGPDRLLLDELCLPDMAAAVALRDRLAPAIGLEASGSITLDNIRAVAATGVDFISVGSLTKHVRAIDLSMRFRFDG
jgi:nicotinate-nucleotide pyrophosphorylase (carboxylating)